MKVRIDLREGCDDSAKKVEEEKADRSHPLFDIVAKNPEIEHIPNNMEPSSVEEHGGKKREEGRKTGGEGEVVSYFEFKRNDRKLINKPFGGRLREKEFVKKESDTDGDQDDRDDREAAGPVQVFVGDHEEG